MTLGIRAPVPPEQSESARELATRLMSALEPESARVFAFDGVDLAPAVAQMLFLAIRSVGAGSGEPPRTGPAATLARVAFAHGLRIARRRPPVDGRVAAITLNPAHAEILRPIEAKLAEADGPPIVQIWDGGLRGHQNFAAPPLPAYLPLASLPRVMAKYRSLRAALQNLAVRWEGVADEAVIGLASSVLRRELHRATLDAACLTALAEQRPVLMVTFDEIGRRARLVGPIAARYGIPSLDLPHAEAADPLAIRGAIYDVFGVFGPRAREVLQLAGVAPRRIREIGPSRFDALVSREPVTPVSPRRLVFASQWLGGQMTAAVKRATIQIALQAASGAAPCEFVIKPHPLERDRIADEVLSAGIPPGVTAFVERSRALYDLLGGAWMLLTGWSNAAFEGLLAHVPAICITATGGEPPTTFVEEGLALGATSVEEAVAAVKGLMDPEVRGRALTAARSSLTGHIGPLDGRAAERAAALILEMSAPRATSPGQRGG